MEVDAKYIKGMLKNPDIAPSASINCWILSILMFHFTLVHVPGTHHGPDGLSRRRAQPGDEEEPEDDFDDWIDQVNGFAHFVNSPSYCNNVVSTAPPVTCYIFEDTQETTPEPDDPTIQEEQEPQCPYSIVPRTEAAIAADE